MSQQALAAKGSRRHSTPRNNPGGIERLVTTTWQGGQRSKGQALDEYLLSAGYRKLG